MKNKNIVFVAIWSGLLLSCSNSSSDLDESLPTSDNQSNQYPESTTDETYSEPESTPDGTYAYSEENLDTKITVSGSYWSGSTTIYGQTEYDNGGVKGNSIYDESGMVEIGFIDGNFLTTSLGGKRVTLRKN